MTKENVNTPYDDAFRTLLVKCPMLMIPLVNEAFHEKYEPRQKVNVFHNEFLLATDTRRSVSQIPISASGINDIMRSVRAVQMAL